MGKIYIVKRGSRCSGVENEYASYNGSVIKIKEIGHCYRILIDTETE